MCLMLYRRIWRLCIVFFVQNPTAVVLKVTYRLQYGTLTNMTPLYTCSGLYPAFSQHHRVSFVICREQYEEAQAFRRNIYA